MKKLIFLFLTFITVATYGQKPKIYNNPAFKDHPFSNIEKMAIIPFHVPFQSVNLELAHLKEMQNAKAVEYQNDFYSYLLDRQNLSSKIQNIQITNAILKQNHIDIDSLQSFTPKELANLLHVDAIINGSITRRISGYSRHSSNIIHCVVGLNDKNNTQIWQYNLTVAKSRKKSVDKITAAFLQKAMNAFPGKSNENKTKLSKLNPFNKHKK